MTIYIAVAIDYNGNAKCAWTENPVVPDGFCQPGEIAFVIEPLDSKARHLHEYPPSNQHGIYGP